MNEDGPLVYFWDEYPIPTHRLGQIPQISCLICLPDKSGNFIAFRAKIAQNTAKSRITGFGMVNQTAPRLFFSFSGEKGCAPFGANARSKVVGKS